MLPGLSEVSGSNLLPQVVTPLYLLLWSSLTQGYSARDWWLSLVSVAVPSLGPLLWRFLVWA